MDTLVGRENVSSAGNQQERLIKIGWVVGFVDGEGCFSIGFVQQPKTKKHRGYNTGYQVDHTFAVTQGAKSLSVLQEIQKFFGVGKIYINRRKDNHKEDMYVYSVSKREHLLKVIIPFFKQNPLHTAKRLDYGKFTQCVQMMSRGEHLTMIGLSKIAEITSTMNRCKPRKYLIRILRDQTPTTTSCSQDKVHSA